MQTIKRRFFAMRNGVIADTLRKAGVDYPVIFGLNMPQLAEIAADYGKDRALACMLWADRRSRESLLMAPMVCPVDELDGVNARQWARECPTIEVADVLCLKLLRNHPEAVEIALENAADPDDMVRYTALRLMLNILTVSKDASGLAARFRPAVEAENARACRLTLPLVHRLAEEIDLHTDG